MITVTTLCWKWHLSVVAAVTINISIHTCSI